MKLDCQITVGHLRWPNVGWQASHTSENITVNIWHEGFLTIFYFTAKQVIFSFYKQVTPKIQSYVPEIQTLTRWRELI